MRGISVVSGLFFKWVIEVSSIMTMAEMGKRVNKSLLLFLRLNMADVVRGELN